VKSTTVKPPRFVAAVIAFAMTLAMVSIAEPAAATSWTNLGGGTKQWTDIATSSDGKKVVAVARGGNISISSNSGSTWVVNTAAGTKLWSGVAMTPNGSTIAATADNAGGGLWISTNGGVSWTSQAFLVGKALTSVTMTSDGVKIAAVEGSGHVYTSTDSGANWTDNFAGTAYQDRFFDVDSSANGSKLVTARYYGYVWISTDWGASWTTSGNRDYWKSIAISDDGSKIVVGSETGYNSTVDVSTDGGSSFSHRTPSPLIGTNSYWGLAMSGDGSTIFASDRYFSGVGNDGYVWKSTNDGASWSQESGTNGRAWNAVTSNVDGTVAFAATFYETIWGSAPPAAPTFSGSTPAIPDTNVGSTSATQTETITNTGNADLIFGPSAVTLSGTNSGDITIVSDNCSNQTLVPTTGTCTVTYTFTPGARGSRTASMDFASNDADSPNSVTLSGTGLAPNFSSTTPSIPNTNVGTTSATQTVTVTNNGDLALVYGASAVTISGANAADYTILTDTCSGSSVAVSATCAVTYTFTPSDFGTRTASLVFADNAPSSPHSVALNAVGLAPSFTYSVGAAVPDTNVGSTSSTQTLTVTNIGNAALIYGAGAVVITGTNASDFSIVADNCSNQSVAASGTCTVTYSFTPTIYGNRTANIVLTDNDRNSPHSVSLTALGLGAGFFVVSSQVPTTVEGTSSQVQTVTVTNVGNMNLVYSNAAVAFSGPDAGDFTIMSDGCSNQSISPASTCVITFVFKPSSAGQKVASLDFADNSVDNPHAVPFTATANPAKRAPKTVTDEQVTVTPQIDALHVDVNFSGSLLFEPNSYVVTASPSGNSCIISGSQSSCTILGLTAGVEYVISIVAKNEIGSSGTYVTPKAYIPIAKSQPRVTAKLPIINFKGDSSKLKAAFKAKIAEFISTHSALTEFTCTGYTAGKPVLKSDRKLAHDRALAICNYIKKLLPDALVTVIGKTPGLPFGPKYRKVLIVGFEPAA
jgi:hypothetical protein